MKNNTKKDPRDYTLRELPALCVSMEDCKQCPFDKLRGPCHSATCPADWDLGDPAPEINQEIHEAAQKFVDELVPALTDSIQAVAEAIKIMVAHIRDDYIGEDPGVITRPVTLRDVESITVEGRRDRNDA